MCSPGVGRPSAPPVVREQGERGQGQCRVGDEPVADPYRHHEPAAQARRQDEREVLEALVHRAEGHPVLAGDAPHQLALFDELMRRIPREHGVTFSSVDQSLQNFALILAPSLGGWLVVAIGIRNGLIADAALALAAFALFAYDWWGRRAADAGRAHPVEETVRLD